jgi:hypothetical protein
MWPLESSVQAWGALSFWLITVGAISASLGVGAAIVARRYEHQLTVLTETQNQQEKDDNQKAIADAGARAAESTARAAEANAGVAIRDAARKKAAPPLRRSRPNRKSVALVTSESYLRLRLVKWRLSDCH